MNTDIRISVDFWGHAKTRKLIKRFGVEGPVSLLKLWCYTAKHRPDGDLCHMDHIEIAMAAEWEGDADEYVNTLCDYRWLERRDGFYCVHDWGVHNPWASKADERSEKARKAAQAMHDKRKSMQGACYEHASSMQGAVLNACGEHAPSPSPKPKEKDTPLTPQGGNARKKSEAPDCPYDEIVRLYHALLPQLPTIDEVSDTLKKTIQKRWTEKGHSSLEWWRWYFDRASRSDFLMGRKPGCDFLASFPWLVGPNNMTKVLGGTYFQSSGNTPAPRPPLRDLSQPEIPEAEIEECREYLRNGGSLIDSIVKGVVK